MIKKCIVCNKEFITYPSKIKLGRGKYCSKECCLLVTNRILEENGKITRFKEGQKAHNFKGFIYSLSRNGGKKYKLIYSPEHPNCDKHGYVREHRKNIELKIGRYLKLSEIVHHIDGNTLNNNIENLKLMTKKEHDCFCLVR